MRHGLVCSTLLGVLACACGKDEPIATSKTGVPEAPKGTWRQLGFDTDNSRNNRAETQISTSNVAALKSKWLVRDVTTGVTSTPAVWGGIVYFGEWGRTVRAVRVSDGSEVWRTPVNGPPRSSLLVTEDRVFGSCGAEVFSLNRNTGELLWSQRVEEHPTANIESSPALIDGKIVIGVAGFEISLNKADYTFRGSVVGLDAENGHELWRVWTTANDATSGAGVSVWSSAAIDPERKRVFIGTGNTYEQPASPFSDSVLAINYETGERAWHTQFTAGDVFTLSNVMGPDADIGASPNLFRAGGRDLVGAGSKAGLYKALDRDTGAVVWERKLGGGSPLGGIMSTSATDDGFVYVASNSGAEVVTTKLSMENGGTQWETKLTGQTYGALTLANGVLYQPTIQGVLHALDAASGAELWSIDLGTDLGGGVSVVDGSLYVPRGFSFLTATHPNTAGLAAFSLDGAAQIDFVDAGSLGRDAGKVTETQCLVLTAGGIKQECKDCGCRCDSTAVGACGPACWELFRCVVDSCGTEDFTGSAGKDCVKRSCTDVKLLPPEVQSATLGAAACMVSCKDSC